MKFCEFYWFPVFILLVLGVAVIISLECNNNCMNTWTSDIFYPTTGSGRQRSRLNMEISTWILLWGLHYDSLKVIFIPILCIYIYPLKVKPNIGLSNSIACPFCNILYNETVFFPEIFRSPLLPIHLKEFILLKPQEIHLSRYVITLRKKSIYY